MKRIVFLTAFVLLSAGFLFGSDFTVTYMTGTASEIDGSDSYPLDIGSSVASTSSVEIEEGGVLELDGSAGSLTLIGPGIFQPDALLGRSRKKASPPLSSLLRNRLSRMLSDDEVVKPSSVMGVRGAAADESEITWMSGESDLFIIRGREEMERGDLAAAGVEFAAGLDIAREYGEIESETQLSFLLSYVQALDGESGRALVSLQGIEPDPYADWYPEYRLHFARLLFDAGAPERAAAILTRHQSIRPLEEEDELLLGISLLESKNRIDQTAGKELLAGIARRKSPAAPIAASFLEP